MNEVVTLGMILGLILTPILPKPWQRMLAAVLTAILGLGFLKIVANEGQKAEWLRCNIRIEQPTKQLLIELRDGYSGDAPKAEALASYMVNNWHRIGVVPWLKTVDEVRSEFPNNDRHKEAEQTVPSDGHKPSSRDSSTDPTSPADAH